MKHLFKNLSLDNFNKQDIISTLTEDLNKSDVYMTFKWTSKRNLLFYQLHLKHNGNTVKILDPDCINDSSGIYTFHIGSFEDKTEIEIIFGVKALKPIPKLIVLLSQTNPTFGFQASPKDPGSSNKIESGNDLEETIKYKIQ